METEGPITQLLRRYGQGDKTVTEEVIPLLYDELRGLARQRLRSERPGHTLDTTALVHECYMRLIRNRQLDAENRGEFMAIASQTMRRILVDYARTRNRQKRGGAAASLPIEDVESWLTDREAEETLALDAALDKLRTLDPRSVEVVELRFFGGLTLEETAESLGVSAKTVQRIWLAARAWLRKEIGSTLGPD